ncbi:MAG: 4Fe-4S dicluster domain-containing protein [Calditrichia bacterium]
MSYAILFDTTRCVGCESCVEACVEKNNLPEDAGPQLSAHRFTRVVSLMDDEVFIRQMCMHCEDPSCVSVCPVTAFEKTSEGPVVYHPDRCMGCRYCMVACPFDVPKYEWNKSIPVVKKCQMCYDRVKIGQLPACVEACPAEATVFGKREDLLEEARKRIKENPDTYYPHIYGEKEAGGTSVLFISQYPPEQLGLKTKKFHEAFPKYTWKVMKEIPNVVSVGGVFLYGLYWIINRRDEVARVTKEGGNENEN